MSILGLPVCIIDLSPSRKMLPFLQHPYENRHMTTTRQSQTDSLEYDDREWTHPLSLIEQCSTLGNNITITAEFNYYENEGK